MNDIDFMLSIKLMGQGMTAIFLVMLFISVVVYLLTRFLKKEKSEVDNGVCGSFYWLDTNKNV
ncbi:MAG: hypothetical protein IJB48_00405 [Clostridia bacterium]|nr:hypothetical protein [Clostridia bacterium]